MRRAQCNATLAFTPFAIYIYIRSVVANGCSRYLKWGGLTRASPVSQSGRLVLPSILGIAATHSGNTWGASSCLFLALFLAGKAWLAVGGAALCCESLLPFALGPPDQIGQGSAGGECTLSLAPTLGLCFCWAPLKPRRSRSPETGPGCVLGCVRER